MSHGARAPLAGPEFVEWLRREGASRYHDSHPVHVLMHEGKLTELNCRSGRQSLLLSNTHSHQGCDHRLQIGRSRFPPRMWIRRVHDHDGERAGEGGLELWLRLGRGSWTVARGSGQLQSVLRGCGSPATRYVDAGP